MTHVAHKFEHLLQTYRRPDDREWSGAELAKATGGAVLRSYVTNLRKGRIESPGYEKMRAIAKAMGFPPEVWFEEGVGEGSQLGSGKGQSIAEKVEYLFEVVKNPKTSEPYTNAETARLSAGELTEEAVEGIRTGRVADSLVSQRGALAATFGVPPSYLLDRGKDPSVLDEEVLDALADETASAILRESARLSAREKEIVLGIVRQFGSQIDDAQR